MTLDAQDMGEATGADVEATIGGGGGLVVGRQCCLVAVAPHNHNLQRGTAPMAAALAGTLVDKSFQLPQGPGGIK